MKQVIKCGHLFDVNSKQFRSNALIYIYKNIIEKIEFHEVPEEGYELLDLSNQYVLPGLIDCHVHLNMNGENNAFDTIASELQGDLTLKAYSYAMRDLMAGFTTLRDEGAVGYTDVALKNMINQGIVKGPRLFVSGRPLGTTGGHADSHFNPMITGEHSLGIIVDDPDACRKGVRENLKWGADQIKIMATGGVISFGDDPGAPEFTMEELSAICEEAARKGHITSAHTHGTEGIKMAIRAGVTSIEHGTMLDEEGLSLMLEKGTYLIPTLIAGYHIMLHGLEAGIPPFIVEKCADVVKTHTKSFSLAYHAGANIAFGTDTGTPFSYHGEQAEEFELMVQNGMTPVDALLSATKVASKLLRLNDKIGSIEPGKFADIIAVNHNPLENIRVLKDVSFVMKDGEVFKNEL